MFPRLQSFMYYLHNLAIFPHICHISFLYLNTSNAFVLNNICECKILLCYISFNTYGNKTDSIKIIIYHHLTFCRKFMNWTKILLFKKLYIEVKNLAFLPTRKCLFCSNPCFTVWLGIEFYTEVTFPQLFEGISPISSNILQWCLWEVRSQFNLYSF